MEQVLPLRYLPQHLDTLLMVGLMVIGSFFAGRLAKAMKLPSIVGFMLIGVVLGPSALGLVDDTLQHTLGFITRMALGFVAVSIGLELSLVSLRKQGVGIVAIILAESLGAFVAVAGGLYALTRDLPLSLVFGAIAPASAPAGTVAVIRELRARGSLTKALYAVVGFDDGLGIVIFGFAAAGARSLLGRAAGHEGGSLLSVIRAPAIEVLLSMAIGTAVAVVFCVLARRIRENEGVLVLATGAVLATTGLCTMVHASLILTNMIVGLVIVNTQPPAFTQRLGRQVATLMPLLFVLFFTLAGANLHLAALPGLGLIGLVYFLMRSLGLMAGSRLGAIVGRVEEKVKKYLGLGILSQAGVAIGLSLAVKTELHGLGARIAAEGSAAVTRGDYIGATVLTTVTATCIIFELVGPVLTKVALTRAGEAGAAA